MQQAHLGMTQYQAAMQEEATKVGKDADSTQREKNASENWQLLMSVVKAKPDNFNSGSGIYGRGPTEQRVSRRTGM